MIDYDHTKEETERINKAINDLANPPKALTYRELKEILNKLPEASLEFPVCWWGDERAGTIKSVAVMDEDWVAEPGEHCEPISIYDSVPKEEIPSVVYAKGQPMLEE